MQLFASLLAAATFAAPLGLDLYMPVPEDNPLTAAKVELGRRLFHDRRLSRDGSTACATCHDPQRAFSDGRPLARGIGGAIGARHAPAIVNRGYGQSFFWDGRAGKLEDQVLQPILNSKEMGMDPASLVVRLRRDRRYRREFHFAFGREPNTADLSRALASYVRTIRSGDSRFDRYLYGRSGTLTAEEERGFSIFSSKANCWVCHTGSNFTDERFHNTGVAWKDGRAADDGRFEVTQNPADHSAFKTPTLREVSRTAPYMHDGSIATLEEVVEYYDRGGNRNPGLDSAIRPLHLTAEEKRALASFLNSLSGVIQDGVTR
jgi:cytochrome c peroxidase